MPPTPQSAVSISITPLHATTSVCEQTGSLMHITCTCGGGSGGTGGGGGLACLATCRGGSARAVGCCCCRVCWCSSGLLSNHLELQAVTTHQWGSLVGHGGGSASIRLSIQVLLMAFASAPSCTAAGHFCSLRVCATLGRARVRTCIARRCTLHPTGARSPRTDVCPFIAVVCICRASHLWWPMASIQVTLALAAERACV